MKNSKILDIAADYSRTATRNSSDTMAVDLFNAFLAGSDAILHEVYRWLDMHIDNYFHDNFVDGVGIEWNDFIHDLKDAMEK